MKGMLLNVSETALSRAGGLLGQIQVHLQNRIFFRYKMKHAS